MKDFPFTDDAEGVRSWQEPLEEWLADLGRAVFEKAPFPIALVGFEGTTVSEDELKPFLEGAMPEERWMGVLRREQDAVASYPTTIWGGPIGTRWEDLVDVTPWRIRIRNRLRALLKRQG